MATDKPRLPQHIEARLPEIKEHAIMDLSGDTIVVANPDGSVDSYETLYDAATGLGKANTDFDVTSRITAKFGGGSMFISYELPGKTTSVGMLMPYTDLDRRESLERAYEHSLACAEAHEKNPSDFYTSFQFLDSHVAMWSPLKNEPTFSWDTSGLTRSIDIGVDGSSGDTKVLLEWGAPCSADSPASRYHDWRLDVEEATYEEAIVALATRMAICYTPQGVEVEDVDLEEPEWINIIKARVAQVEKDSE